MRNYLKQKKSAVFWKRTLVVLIALVSLCLPHTVNGQSTQPEKQTARPQTEQDAETKTKTLLTNILTKQTNAWNEGDLETFMATYWKSDKLTFSSRGRTTYGWQATLDNYKRGYPTKEKMGQLHFDGLEISMIESNSALVLGRWHLRMQDNSKVDGNFSLVVKKFEDGWKIIHDHSSSTETKTAKEDE